MKRWVAIVGSIAVLASATVAAADPSQSAKASYLVGLHPGASAQALSGSGIEIGSEYANVGAVQIRATAAAAKALEHNPNVDYVEEDAPRYTMGALADGTYTWGLQAVNAPAAWTSLGHKGTGIKVCILDTGINLSHPEFNRGGTSVIKAYKDFSGSPNGIADIVGHGTHVAGTIAGQLNASGSYIGVAPGVDLYIAKVLGDDGSGSTSNILNGANWCASQGANILSMSLGGGLKSKTEENTYNSIYNGGKLIIAAAGNDGNNRVSYPAGYANVISIAAVDENLAKASFSQYNSDVELAGPGVNTLSSVPLGTGSKSTVSEGSTTYKSAGLEFAPNGTVNGPLVECGTAETTSSCTGKPASGAWIAMISRGTNAFSDKVTNVMGQGASAAIIANNDTAAPDDAGSFTLGAAGNWIPTASVSYNSGVAIRGGGLSTGTVSLTAWDYAYYQGTSMATPHVSAVAALAWSAKPTLSNTVIRSVLQTTAQDLGAAGRDTNFGYGLVKADAAVNLAKTK
ncbi:MAG TPA: S8 family serine peptidase [Symbiobacteriaceae bacterium]|nr:S8 family serine peptidase [Symbiobacteriaceae bacterium]